LTSEEKALLEKLSKCENMQPRPEKGEKGFFDKVKEFF
jgi:molecular chaperone DnaJ